MDEVKSVGPEIYGNNSSVPFRSLKTLSFEHMREWREWIPHGSSENVEAFPQLQEFSLVRCFKLLGRLPECLPSLERLVIRECEELVVPIPSIPTLRELEIWGCKKLVWRSTVDLSSPNSLPSPDMSNNQVFLTGPLNQQLPNLEELAICNVKKGRYFWHTRNGLLQDVSSIQKLWISSCPQLLSLVSEEEEDQLQHQVFPCKLRDLYLGDCHSLVKLPLALFGLHSLKVIDISGLDSLESLPDGWTHNNNTPLESLEIHRCNSLTCIARIQLPPSLKRIWINDCKNIKTLIDEDQDSEMKGESSNSGCSSRYAYLLKYLHINFCPSLTSLSSKNDLPDTLEEITVFFCSKLAFLSLSGNLPKALKALSVCECSELESIARRLDHSTSVKQITIYNCQNLKVLPADLHKAHHLQELEIRGCPKLVSLPERGLPTTELRKLCISECENLKALPNRMHNLTSLRSLEITSCPSIGSIPDDDLPTNVSTNVIDYQKMYKPLFERELHRFASITALKLVGESSDVVSFRQEDTRMPLPASLTSLEIDSFPNLQSLSSIENLTSLEYLQIKDCPKLEYFAEDGLPTSLLSLCISGCPVDQRKVQNGRRTVLALDNPYT